MRNDINVDLHHNLELFLVLCMGFMAVVIVATIIYLKLMVPFIQERSYIKMEMRRSFNESEYRYWKRKLVRLYFEHVPLLGRLWRRKN